MRAQRVHARLGERIAAGVFLLDLLHPRTAGLGVLVRQHRRIALQQRIDLLDVLHRVELHRALVLVTRHRRDHVVPVAVELVHHPTASHRPSSIGM